MSHAVAALQVVGAALLLTVFATASHGEVSIWRACKEGHTRVTCVVDGDTLWYQGSKIRVIGIDVPEVDCNCRRERRLAADATAHLTQLLNTRLTRIAFDGEDRYGRALARLWVTGGELGSAMMAAGLAAPYGTGIPAPWCRR